MQFIVLAEARTLSDPDLGLNIKKVGCVIARVMLLRNMITVLFTSAAVDDFMIGFNSLSRSTEIKTNNHYTCIIPVCGNG